MRHRVDRNNLGRTPAHRRAMLRNMVMDLFWWTHGNCSRLRDRGGSPRQPHRVRTTLPKAKAARRLAEKLITLGKKDTLAARRRAAAIMGGNEKAVRVVRILFGDIAPRFIDRPGGYTRIVRLPEMLRLPDAERTERYRRQYGRRLGDGAPMVFLELVTGTVAQKHEDSHEA